jgi:2-haloalkanoic acid dehalogenase type II
LVSDYDAVLIDFYGTIADGDREAVESVCAGIVEACEIAMSPAAFAIKWGERFFATVERSNHADFRTLYECEIVSLTETLKDFDFDGDASAFVQGLEDYWRNPPVHADALDFLRDCSLPTVCVSNADTEPLFSAIERHNLHFDAVITSEMSRCYKPDVKIFQDALETMNLSPNRVFHVGDSLHSDIEGASAAGIEAIWIKRDTRIHDIGQATPTRTIRRLTECLDLLTS